MASPTLLARIVSLHLLSRFSCLLTFSRNEFSSSDCAAEGVPSPSFSKRTYIRKVVVVGYKFIHRKRKGAVMRGWYVKNGEKA